MPQPGSAAGISRPTGTKPSAQTNMMRTEPIICASGLAVTAATTPPRADAAITRPVYTGLTWRIRTRWPGQYRQPEAALGETHRARFQFQLSQPQAWPGIPRPLG